MTRRRVLLALGVLVISVSAGLWPAATTEVAATALAATERRLAVPGAASVPWAGPVPAEVWRIEGTETSEIYSNGLRIDLSFATRNRPRAEYPVFPLSGTAEFEQTAREPRGIVYHTTESHLAPFEEASSQRLKRLGRNLLEVLRAERSYHYLIDRFGRVFRVVEESDAANHSGRSVWGDSRGLYVNLNDSFLGIAFEGQTSEADAVTAAQITSARQLTEMLRSRYPSIHAENCVAHAQVSVSQWNMLISDHTDWIRDFPFAALGLPDNYAIAPPSLYAFGFGYDDSFVKAAGEPWPGLALAGEMMRERARIEGTTEARYRGMLQHRYREIVAALKTLPAQERLER